MSGPLRSLRNSNKLPNGKRIPPRAVSVERSRTMISLKTNAEEEDMAAGSWSPPPTHMAESEDFTTTDENYAMRRSRALRTLRYLLNQTHELIEQPTQYISDIRWFRYLSSIKHTKEEFVNECHASFVSIGLPKLFKTLWTDHMCVTSVGQWENVPKDTIEALYHILMALWFISSAPLHQHSMFLELCEFVLAMISSDAFKINYRKNKRVSDCMKALLGILYQFAKNIEETKAIIRDSGGVGFLQRATGHKHDFGKNIKGRTLMILAYVLNEEEQKRMNVSDTVLDFLIRLLKDCLTTKDHKSPQFNYNALEILHGLNRLAVSDSNKIGINDRDGLPAYYNMIQDGSLEEQEEACKGLWTLCFNQLVAEDVLRNPNMLTVLQNHAKSESDTLRTAACGVLWTVQELRDSHEKLVAIHKSAHVMISYSWSIQSEAKEVKQKLLDHGYRVWMDIDNMSGSTLSSMSQAIERSVVVLMLLSDQYKNSAACRAEAEYTYKLQREFIPLKIQSGYTADGWLGMLIGMKMSFDLTSHNERDSAYEQLINVLGDRGKGPPIPDDEPEPEAQVEHSAAPVEKQVPVNQVSSSRELKCASWSEEQVGQWIEEKRLQDVATRLGGEINGEMLAELKYIFLEELDHYYEITRKDLQLPAVTLLRLSASLRSLT